MGKSQGFPRAEPGNLRKWVDFLAGDIGPRPYSAPDKLKRVAEELRNHLMGLGYVVSLQKFIYREEQYFNVVAAPAGEDPLAESAYPVLVAGAHYDTVSTTPGADDNASAVAGLMELARILSRDPPAGLRLVAFCLEEPPVFRTRNMGSYHYASHLRKTGQSVKGMICLEMIGYFSEKPNSQKFPFPFMKRMFPTTGNFIALVGNNRSRDFTLRVKEGFSKGSPVQAVTLNAPAIVIGIDLSDHWSFNKHRFPAVMVTDTAFYRNPHYHRPTDTPHTLDYEKSALVVDGIVNAVLEITGGGNF
jgi:Zn-dependent M28 family amino/carboxypeptidase